MALTVPAAGAAGGGTPVGLKQAQTTKATPRAENPRFKDVTPSERPATLVEDLSTGGGGITTLAAATRYHISGVNWASSRNDQGGYVLGEVHNGDKFDVTDTHYSSWRGGFSYRAECGYILNTSLSNERTSSSAACSSSISIPPQQFGYVFNCVSCGTYTTAPWISPYPTATACLNLTVNPQKITQTVHGACQDPRTIYSTDQIGWRYYTKDLQWIAIKDLRWGDNDGTWMFLPSNSQVLNTVCHSSGCWWIG
jgi:hypothetical protein